jgi:GxxExxY protein
MEINNLTYLILKCAYSVHSELGPGLLESAYEECLFYELNLQGLKVEKQKALPLVYQNVKLDVGYRLDLLVDNRVVVEIKSVEIFSDVHMAQVLTYLKLSKCQIGLLINFNVKSLKQGIKRLINENKLSETL